MKSHRQILVDGRSIRSISREMGLSRIKIRKYLADGTPQRYWRQQPAKCHRLEPYKTLLEQWYSDQQRPKQERWTAHKYYAQLLLEGYQEGCTTVCRFIKRLKDQGASISEAYIPLHFEAVNAMQFD